MNILFDTGIWTTVASTVAGAVATALLYRSLMKARVRSIVAETYDKLIETLSEQVQALQGQVDKLQARLDDLSKKELHYLEQITTLTRERNGLLVKVEEKEAVIKKLEKQLQPSQAKKNVSKNRNS